MSTAAQRTLSTHYNDVRLASGRLIEPLDPEDCALQSMEDASPAKWHLAHTTWYFETFVLDGALPGYRAYHPEYRYLFNSYYNSVGAQYTRNARGLLTRPNLSEVLRYRAHVDRHMEELLARESELSSELRAVIELGIHHEQQHQELLLTDVKHLLAANPLRPAYHKIPAPGSLPAPALCWFAYQGGVREIGHAGTAFAFDNEGPRHRVFVDDFELASRAVTNGEYQAFIDDGGYRNPAHWLADGWATVQRQAWEAPLYWEREGKGFRVKTLAGMEAVCPDEPTAHVSFYEADAYARWARARLPTEAEWECAASGRPVEGNFVDTGRLHPAPAVEQDSEPAQLFGDVWEWTRSTYAPYPGFHPPEGAIGEYNGKFMSNQIVLRGGSCATPRDHVRATYRNFFYPDARWQFSGFRLARDR
jgi:ergothioneine biosynthesis protein EgtB